MRDSPSSLSSLIFSGLPQKYLPGWPRDEIRRAIPTGGFAPVRNDVKRQAFTLVEMLAVMGIIVLLIGLTGPAVNALKSANDVGQAVYEIAGVLQQARAYAVTNNTYVYAGIAEVEASQSASAAPQVSGTGKSGRDVLSPGGPGQRWGVEGPRPGDAAGAGQLPVPDD